MQELHNLLIKLELRFKHPKMEQDYNTSLELNNSLNFQVKPPPRNISLIVLDLSYPCSGYPSIILYITDKKRIYRSCSFNGLWNINDNCSTCMSKQNLKVL